MREKNDPLELAENIILSTEEIVSLEKAYKKAVQDIHSRQIDDTRLFYQSLPTFFSQITLTFEATKSEVDPNYMLARHPFLLVPIYIPTVDCLPLSESQIKVNLSLSKDDPPSPEVPVMSFDTDSGNHLIFKFCELVHIFKDILQNRTTNE